MLQNKKKKKKGERAQAKEEKKHENEFEEERYIIKEISKTIINTNFFRKMTSSSFEINVQNQSSNPQSTLRTKHSYQYLEQLIESSPS